MNQRRAFSLLEVIIATAILAASTVMLMSMFSTGDRHTSRADERTVAQMLCQSKLDELLADPSQIIPIQADTIRQYPGWIWSLDVQPTAIDGFVKLTVAVTRIPGMETGADLELATTTDASSSTETTTLATSAISSLPTSPTYQLTRWTKFDGDLEKLSDTYGSSSSEAGASIFDRIGGGL